MRLFWDVDTQNDFMDKSGALYVPEAETIRPELNDLMGAIRENNELVWGSTDYHAPDDEEISEDPDMETTFPPHCLAEGDGALSIAETAPQNPTFIPSAKDGAAPEELADGRVNEVYFRKQHFDVFSNPNVEPAVERLNPDSIVVFGVTLDVCVRFAVEGFLERGYNVTVVRDATRALDESKRPDLLTDWEQKGAEIQKTNDVVAKLNKSVRKPRTTND